MTLSKLKQLRGKRTLEDLSEATGISVSQISRFESGKRDPGLTDLRRLAEALETTVFHIIDEPRLTKVPIVGSVGAGGSAEFYPEVGDEFLEADVPSGTVAVRIRGSSLGFGFDGWFALYCRRFEPFDESMYNRLCVVETEDGRTLIKWVKRAPRRGVNLMSGTGDTEEDVLITAAAVVIDLKPE